MNLDDLTYFLAIAETGLLHRAAVQVGVSQPALTKAVRRLEAQLGVALFERSPKGMRLTQYGVEFQRHATTLRASYESALGHIVEMHSGELAKVRIGATPAAEPLVGRTFLSLLKSRPALRLDLNVQLSDELLRALAEAEIDLAILPMPSDMSDDFDAIRLLSEMTWIVCRKAHPLSAAGTSVDVHALGQYPWILPGSGVSIRRQIEAYFADHQVDGPLVQVQSNYSSPVGAFSLIANTDMLGICSTQHRPVADQLGLMTLHAKGASWPREIACLVRRNDELSPLTRSFRDHLVSEVSKLPGSH